jgi:hypothetical protein
MESMIRKVIPCEFKKNKYECNVQGLSDEPLNCEECGCYKPKRLMPRIVPVLRPHDYMIIASGIV